MNPLTKALLVRLEALPGREAELADFLVGARAIVMDEPGTVAWFALRLGPSSFGVFDVFPDEAARDAHLAGGVGQALGPNTGVLFSEPVIEKIDLLHEGAGCQGVDPGRLVVERVPRGSERTSDGTLVGVGDRPVRCDLAHA